MAHKAQFLEKSSGGTPAVAYIRTSSATNVGGDSRARQEAAVRAFAEAQGFNIVAEFYDAAISGEDQLEARPAFAALLDKIEGNGVRTVLVESADRLARKLVVQEAGIAALQARGVTVWTAGGMNLTDDTDEYRVAMRQVAAVFAQLEKARLVRKLKVARDRASAELEKATGGRRKRIEGRKGHVRGNPEAVQLARRLHRKNPKTGARASLREIAARLSEAGHVTKACKPFSAEQVKRLLAASR